MVMQSRNPSILEAEARVQGQPGLQNEMETVSALGMDGCTSEDEQQEEQAGVGAEGWGRGLLGTHVRMGVGWRWASGCPVTAGS